MSFPHWRIAPSELFQLTPIVPVMVIDRLEDAEPMGRALFNAGISLFEVTLRTPIALEAIQLLREKIPQAIVGVGTITTTEELKAATQAGAQFAISPGITPALLKAGKESEIPLIPGVATVSEVMQAMGAGYTHLKFFPAEAAGGVAMLKAISGPLPNIRFCPTGGIHQGNFLDYLALQNVLCVGGSWILPQALIEQKNWSDLEALASASVAAAKE